MDPEIIPRDAASILLLRGDPPEVLMGLRGARHRFMPNHLVFPGGAVDPEDHLAVLQSLPSAATLARLSASPAHARALAAAAARELEEETGLHLGHPPDLAGLHYLCRAITPPGRPIRFDARFFVIDASHAQGSLAGSGELETLRWHGLSEALALDLSYPTRKVLEQLLLWRAMLPTDRDRLRPTPELHDRAWIMQAPSDPDAAALDPPPKA